MSGFTALLVVCGLAAAASMAAADATATGRDTPALNGALTRFLDARQAELGDLDPERRALLDGLAAYVRAEAQADRPADLVFVCTHNSRRSQMAQLWAEACAARCGLRVRSYSGGTESTAFNPRAVAASERAGFDIRRTSDADNPIYHVSMGGSLPAATCFSKVYDGAPNPSEGFAAVMVCNDADEACPRVDGAALRVAIPYVDPKAHDGLPSESEAYDERCAQIAREMLYVMMRAGS